MQPQAPTPPIRRAARITAVLWLACTASHANVVTYSSSQNLSFPGSTLNGSFNLQQFNPSLGTLTGVSITVGLRDWDGVFTFSYNDFVSIGTSSSLGVRSTVSLPNAANLQTSLSQLLAPDEPLEFFGGGDVTINPTNLVSASNSSSQNSSWAASNGLLGSGSKSINYLLEQIQVDESDGDRTNNLWLMSGALDTSVSYTYDPVAAVPEPSEWALGSVMLVWGGSWMWRRARRQARNS